MHCPSCGSDQIQRLQVAYEAGTSHINTTSRTVGAGFGAGGGVGAANTSTTGTSQSLLAGRAAPPAKKSYWGAFFPALGVWIVAMFFGRFLSELISFAGWVVLAVKAYQIHRHNDTVWPSQYQSWLRRWVCHRCGQIFQGS